MELALRKLSITKEQEIKVKELVSNKLSGREIARILCISYAKIWRNMEVMGINKKKGVRRCSSEFFDWEDYKNDYNY